MTIRHWVCVIVFGGGGWSGLRPIFAWLAQERSARCGGDGTHDMYRNLKHNAAQPSVHVVAESTRTLYPWRGSSNVALCIGSPSYTGASISLLEE